MIKIYKVTAAYVGDTKRGFKVYKIQLNNSFWASQLVPNRSRKQKYNKLYQLYTEANNSLDFLIEKYVSVLLSKNDYGIELIRIDSFDALTDFKNELDLSKGKSFASKLPIYDFLVSTGRNIEHDNSIKLISNFGDMRVSKVNGVDICYPFCSDKKYLTLKNINLIFDHFFNDVELPNKSYGGRNSYYKIDYSHAAIVQMDNHVKVSYRMTTSGDYDRWDTNIVLKLGDALSEKCIEFLSDKHQHSKPIKQD